MLAPGTGNAIAVKIAPAMRQDACDRWFAQIQILQLLFVEDADRC
jgi:hypothetical protein